jgi:hypothetical protein
MNGDAKPIKHKGYLITVIKLDCGYQAWSKRADGEMIAAGLGFGIEIGTHIYDKRAYAIAAARTAIDTGVVS